MHRCPFSTAAALAGIAGLIVVPLAVPSGTLWMHAWGLTGVSICAAAVIAYAASVRSGLIYRIISVKPMVYIGKISYGFYLYHYPILRTFQKSDLQYPSLCGVAVSLFIAALSYCFIEKNFYDEAQAN